MRNALCVGAEYGNDESVFALVDNFCWPDPVADPLKTACWFGPVMDLEGMPKALKIPLVSGKDSMKNDFRGKRTRVNPVSISVPPTLADDGGCASDG